MQPISLNFPVSELPTTFFRKHIDECAQPKAFAVREKYLNLALRESYLGNYKKWIPAKLRKIETASFQCQTTISLHNMPGASSKNADVQAHLARYAFTAKEWRLYQEPLGKAADAAIETVQELLRLNETAHLSHLRALGSFANLNLETAVQSGKVMQSFESESLITGGDRSQKVKAPPDVSDSDSKDCITLLPSNAVSRFKESLNALEDQFRFAGSPDRMLTEELASVDAAFLKREIERICVKVFVIIQELRFYLTFFENCLKAATEKEKGI